MSDEKLEQDISRVIGKMEAPTASPLVFRTGRQSIEQPIAEVPELVNNWVRSGDLTLMVGFGGVGKSTIAANLAIALAAGVNFINNEVSKPAPVVYLDLEMGEYEFRSRLNMLLKQYPEAAQDNFYFACLSNFTMRNRQNLSRLKDALVSIRPKLLVVDNHASFHGGDPNRENEMMENVILPFREIMTEFGLGVLYLMHTPWTDASRPRGTAAIFDAASTVVAVTKPQVSTRLLKWTKKRSVRQQAGPNEVEIGYNADTYMVYSSAGAAVDEVLSKIEFPAKRSLVAQRLAVALEISVRAAYYRIESMVADKVLIEKGKGMVDRGLQRLVDFIR